MNGLPMINFIVSKNILIKYQHGFIRGKSTNDAITKLKSFLQGVHKKRYRNSNLYLRYQLMQKFETGINLKLNTSSFCGIQDAVEI